MSDNGMELKGTRVLCLDDNKQEFALLSEMFNDMGIICDSVSGSKEALQFIQREIYDLIFIRYMMNNEDGITAMAKIHNTHRCDDIPIILLTSAEAYLAKNNFFNAGFSGCLAQPFSKKKLKDTICHCLNLSMEYEQEKNEKERILVVDDDTLNLVVAKDILSNQYEVSIASSGKEAFEYLENNMVDLILLDIHMPKMNGFTFLVKSKADPRLKDIPIIFLTADSKQASELRCFELGAVDFITKPFIAEIMLHRIARILELERLQKGLEEEVEKKTLKLNRRSNQLKRLIVQVMKALVGAIDAKDKYTNGHSWRVAEYSKMIAERLNMSHKEQEDIYYIGLLHDFGKIGIPDEIINKPSYLTKEEYAIIKTHTVIGTEILGEMSELPGIAFGTRWHHERYDGNGYPDGLAGENIPLVARIIAVADAYDAMSSKRSYRGVLSQEYIRNEIDRCMGTQFDPTVAKIMLEIMDEDKDYKLHEF